MELKITDRKGPRFGFPVVEMTEKQFSTLALPKSADDLKFVPFGHVIRCSEKGAVDPTVIGQIVRGEEAIASQWGAGLSLPKRFLNRYEVEVVEK